MLAYEIYLEQTPSIPSIVTSDYGNDTEIVSATEPIETNGKEEGKVNLFWRGHKIFKLKLQILPKIMYKVLSKWKDLSESSKQKPWTPFLLKIQVLNCEWRSHLPMKEKTLGSH